MLGNDVVWVGAAGNSWDSAVITKRYAEWLILPKADTSMGGSVDGGYSGLAS
jgi:hypothetical protein